MSQLVHKKQLEEAPLQQELMLFDPESSRFYLLNETMAFIWRNWSGEPIDELLAMLSAHFDGLDETAARAEIQKAIDELVSLQLLTFDGAHAAL